MLANTVPPAAVLRTLSRFSRDDLAGFITVAIDLMNLADGDPDLEATDAEDDFTAWLARPLGGAGCSIADPAEDDDPDHEHDGREPEDVV